MNQRTSRILRPLAGLLAAAINHVRGRNELLLNSASEIKHAQGQVINTQLILRYSAPQQHAGGKARPADDRLIKNRQAALREQRVAADLPQPARDQSRRRCLPNIGGKAHDRLTTGSEAVPKLRLTQRLLEFPPNPAQDFLPPAQLGSQRLGRVMLL